MIELQSMVHLCADFADLQGIVGTTAGTLWYINWTERASIRLVSGHISKVKYLATINSAADYQ